MKKYLLYILAIYTLLGFFFLPLIVKPQLINLVQEQTHASLLCDSISFNPFIAKLSLEGIELKNKDDETLLRLEKISVDLEFYSLLLGAIHIQEIELKNPYVYIEYEKDKTINLLNIIKKVKEEKTEIEKDLSLPRIIIDKFAVNNGLVNYKDFTRTQDFDFSFRRISFVVDDIDTENFGKSDTKLRFHTNLGDGGFFDFKSELLSLKPFTVKGKVDFEASQLYTEWKYLRENLNLEVADGKISLSANYYLNLDDLNQTKISELNLAFNKLRIKPKNQHKDVLNIEHAGIKNAVIFPMLQDVKIEELCLDSLHVKVKRKKNKEIDWQSFIKTNFTATSTPEKKQEEASSPWNVVVENIKLENISLDFEDKAIYPNVSTKLNKLNLYAHNATLLGEEPLPYKFNLLLNDKLNCNGNGSVVHKTLDIQTKTACKGFDITHYKPYIDKLAKAQLKKYDLNLRRASLDFDANVDIKKIEDKLVVLVHHTDISLNKLKLAKRSTKEQLLALQSLQVQGVFLDTQKKRVDITQVSLNGFAINARRYKNKDLNFENLVEPKLDKKPKKAKTKEKPYDVQLKHFAINNAKVTFEDKALSPSVSNQLDRINLDAHNINLKKKTWLDYKLSMRVNKKGKLLSHGKLQHTPLSQKGTFELRKITLKELTPYIQEYAFVNVEDGDISLKTKTYFSPHRSKPDLTLNGSFNLNNLYALDSRDENALIAFSNVNLKTFSLELAPNRFYSDTIDIGSFYVDILIDENKKLNFAKLVKDKNSSKITKETKTSSSTSTSAFPVKIVKVNITEGNVKFADLSIPIEFRTNIHNLNGDIYSISTIPGEPTSVDLSGEVDDYGSTKLSGSLDSFDPKAYTDLHFNFKNLEMNSFSGYSASFAGHEIDGGKLYLDLGYKINDSELQGKNSVIIKQMKLGKEIEDENVTKLPLGFVIALLEDSDGVIDIDMPVEGNLEEPDFKYGALIWRTFGGLIAKAVSSPFKLLGSMMGLDGDALEYLEFEAGSAEILPTEREKLDNITKMMIKRPKINLALTPSYDEKLDKRAMQLDKLIDIVVARSGIKNKKHHKSAMTIDMLEDIYEDLRDDDKLDEIQAQLEVKYPNKDEMYDREYLFALGKLDASLQVVTQEELENLANKRVSLSIKYLHEVKGLDMKRLNVLKLQKVNISENTLVHLPLDIKVK